MLLNCGVGEDSWESLGLQGDSPLNPKGNQTWIFIGRTDAETPILWPPNAKNWLKRPRCWERLRAGGEEEDRGGDGWTASPTRWTWVWPSTRSWWWAGKPCVLQSMASQRVWHSWVTELTKKMTFYFVSLHQHAPVLMVCQSISMCWFNHFCKTDWKRSVAQKRRFRWYVLEIKIYS